MKSEFFLKLYTNHNDSYYNLTILKSFSFVNIEAALYACK